MQKKLAILLCLALAGQLCACAQVDRLKSVELPPLPEVTERPAEEPQATAAPEETAAEAETAQPQAPAEEDNTAPEPVIVSFHKTEMVEYDPAEGEQKILTFSYVTPKVTIPGREDAANAINEYIAMLDETYYTGNDYGDGPSDGYYGMLEQAEDNFTYVRETGADLPLEFSSERFAEVYRMDDKVLVINLGTVSYTGGAHGFYGNRSYVFDTQNGELLSLEQLTSDYEALKAYLVGRMVEMVNTDAELNAAVADYVPEEEREASFAALLRDGSWCLTDEGLIVFSDLYEIAPYAAGVQSFTFSYDELGGRIDAKWRPDAITGAGTVRLLPASELPEGTEVLNKIVLEEEGTDLCIAAEGRISDVRLSRVFYSEWSEGFSLSDPIWYSSVMGNSALEVVTDIPDGYPNLAVSYRTGDGEEHRCLLTQSGEDGSLHLLEEGVKFAD